MTARIPLVINSGAIQELQSGDTFNLGTGASLTSPTIATSMTLSYGTANQVQYLNGSKQLVGDADLTFDGTTLSVAAINVTTVDLTNLEVTNIKAKDGTAAITLADSTGVATLSANPILNAGTANGVAYLNGSKVLTTGSALQFDGTNLTNTQNTASPVGLKINNSSASTSAGTRVSFQYGGSDVGYIGNQFDGGNFNTQYMSASAHIWLQSSSEQMRLTSTGLGIGTSSPSSKLHLLAGTDASCIQIWETQGTTSRQWKWFVTGGAGGGNFVMQDATASVNRLTMDTSGNLGLGVTPSGWDAAYKSIDIGSYGNINSRTNQLTLVSNAYYNGTTWIYKNTNPVALYQQNNGTHNWWYAASGTAGAGFSLTQAMTLDASGNLYLGSSTSSGNLYIGPAMISSNGGANPLIFGINATERMRIDSSGNVGIGTSSPAAKLDVVTTDIPLQLSTVANQTHIVFIDTTNSKTGYLNYANNNLIYYRNGPTQVFNFDSAGNFGLGVTPNTWTGTGVKAFQFQNGSLAASNSYGTELTWNAYYNSGWKYTSSNGTSRYELDGSHKWYIAPSGTAGNAITFTQAMTLDASGNLLVGTTSAVYSSANRGVVNIGGSSGGLLALISGSNKSYMIQTGADLLIENDTATGSIVFGTNSSTERMRIDTSGNVGIGTSSPTTKFQVSGSSFLVGDIVNTGTTQPDSAGWRATNGSVQVYLSAYSYGGAAELNVASNHPVLFKTNNIERMRIDSSGNLLLGTTSIVDLGKISVSYATNANNGITLRNTSSTYSYNAISFLKDTVQVGYIYTNASSTTYATSSDYRLKENIQPMRNALDVVAQLNPVTYTWKADGSDGQGFIAHELQAVVPDCVTGEKDAVDEDGKPIYQGIDTSFLVATLTKAIQELKAELDATKAEVAALKGA